MSRLYQCLEIDIHASQSEIRRAYLKLAMAYHPDRNRGDKAAEARFKEVVSAFEILGDREARALYDQGRIDENGRPCPGGSPFSAGPSRARARRMWHSAAETFAQEFFKNRDRADESGAASRARAFETSASEAGDDDFESMASETTMTDAPVDDESPGEAKDSKPPHEPPASLPEQKQYRLSINFAEACLGTIKHVRLPDKSQFKIVVPAGVETGNRLRVKASGGVGTFVVKITVEPHILFERLDDDILIELPLTPYEAYFGVELDVPSLHGPAKVTIPPKSLDGDEIIMTGMGVRVPGRASGDQIIMVKLAMPRRWSSEFEEVMRGWRTKAPFNPRGKILNLLSK